MKELSIFIDESGDFGKFSHHSPYYIISLIFHEQNQNISSQIKEFDNFDEEISKLAKELSNFIKSNISYLLSFDNIKIYYDNGQTEIKTLINSVFSSNLPNVIMKNILSTDYRLFQVADFICTFD